MIEAYEVVIQETPKILFSEPEKAFNFFCEDESPESWSRTFYYLNDLFEVVELLAPQLQRACKGSWADPYIEGFGVFEKTSTSMRRCYSPDFGFIYYEEAASEIDGAEDVTEDEHRLVSCVQKNINSQKTSDSV